MLSALPRSLFSRWAGNMSPSKPFSVYLTWGHMVAEARGACQHEKTAVQGTAVKYRQLAPIYYEIDWTSKRISPPGVSTGNDISSSGTEKRLAYG